jgi:hypothetical protein
MTVSEFKNEFQIHYNAIASQNAPGLDDYEISLFLTKAQLEIVKNYYTPQGNKYKKGFENSEKRRTDLKELVKTHTSTTVIASSDGLSSTSKFFKIPDDVFLIVYENITLGDDSCFENRQVKVIPKTHDEFNIQSLNPFKQPNHNLAWRLTVSKIGSNKVVELVTPYKIAKYQLRYIKYPRPIILSDFNTSFPGEGVSIDGYTTPNTCELDESIHREILDRAVEIALRDYKPSNLESKIQLDTRNE